MRWKTDDILANGTKKTFRRYALLPTKLHHGYTVWLEYYWSQEIYESFPDDSRLNYWRIQNTSIHHPDRPDTGSTTQ